MSPHRNTRDKDSYTAAHGMSFFLHGRRLTGGPLGSGSAECWRCISPGANSAYILVLTDAGADLAILKVQLATVYWPLTPVVPFRFTWH
jgi:hypothetical protein